jgi:hypothetical protein
VAVALGALEQEWLQLPQLFTSVDRLTHPALVQKLSPLGQTHCPPEQIRPPVHANPHAPQLLESLCRLAQYWPLLQQFWPGGQAPGTVQQVEPVG